MDPTASATGWCARNRVASGPPGANAASRGIQEDSEASACISYRDAPGPGAYTKPGAFAAPKTPSSAFASRSQQHTSTPSEAAAGPSPSTYDVAYDKHAPKSFNANAMLGKKALKERAMNIRDLVGAQSLPRFSPGFQEEQMVAWILEAQTVVAAACGVMITVGDLGAPKGGDGVGAFLAHTRRNLQDAAPQPPPELAGAFWGVAPPQQQQEFCRGGSTPSAMLQHQPVSRGVNPP